MIQYIEREKLDVKKYDTCIEQSLNHKIYAYSWYLDIVADNWGILAYGDYEYVMPLPWRRKHAIYYVYPPEWTQQLGVFSRNIVGESLLENFIKSIPRKFKKITLNFNSGNFNDAFENKLNYFLPLNSSYYDLAKGYSKSRRIELNRIDSQYFNLTNSDNCKDLIDLFICQKKDVINIIPSNFDKLEILVSYLIENKNVQIIKAINKNDDLLGGAIFIIENYKIYYLFSIVSDLGREKFVMSKIIDSVIKQYSSTDYTLDFEGSMVPGIAGFFKSFGTSQEKYFTFKKYIVF